MKSFIAIGSLLISISALASDSNSASHPHNNDGTRVVKTTDHCANYSTHFCKCSLDEKISSEKSDDTSHYLVRIDITGGQKFETVLGSFSTASDCEEATWNYPTCR